LSPDGNGVLKYAKGIEVGHIFKLGTKYSEPMKLDFIDKDNKKKPVIMGCYGIGISRLIMAILEQHHSPELKVLWPDSVTPFKLHIITMGKSQSEEQKIAMSIYDKLVARGYDVMIDDRMESPGVKFKDADLIGIKYRLIVGRRSSEGIVELINEVDATKKEISIKEAIELEF